jgi:uncharacterized protein (TIGR00725 family)
VISATRLRIGVIGSSGQVSAAVGATAEKVGLEIARAGAILVTGGRGGVMESACKGAKLGGGLTIGILPENNLDQASPYLDVAITTGIGYARNYINICSSDAVVSIGGAGGTLSEIGYAMALEKLLVLMRGTGGATDVIARATAFLRDANVVVTEHAQEAVRIVLARIGASRLRHEPG